MNLFQVLSCGERIIVYSDGGSETFITWNQSLTLQLWALNRGASPQERTRNDVWEEQDVRTLSSEPKDFDAAREEALRWHLDLDEGGLGHGN